MVLFFKNLNAPKHFNLKIFTRSRKTKIGKEHQHEYITHTLIVDTLNLFLCNTFITSHIVKNIIQVILENYTILDSVADRVSL